jgi:hypothetical protein
MFLKDVCTFRLLLTINRCYSVSQDAPENNNEVTVQMIVKRVAGWCEACRQASLCALGGHGGRVALPAIETDGRAEWLIPFTEFVGILRLKVIAT